MKIVWYGGSYRFVTSSKAKGRSGFNFVWTEILNTSVIPCEKQGFRCRVSGYCIDHRMECNNLPNCGPGDNSDESDGCKSSSVEVPPIAQAVSGYTASPVFLASTISGCASHYVSPALWNSLQWLYINLSYTQTFVDIVCLCKLSTYVHTCSFVKLWLQ
jgi:hypothetical protein